jgi:hypothetical protein
MSFENFKQEDARVAKSIDKHYTDTERVESYFDEAFNTAIDHAIAALKSLPYMNGSRLVSSKAYSQNVELFNVIDRDEAISQLEKLKK